MKKLYLIIFVFNIFIVNSLRAETLKEAINYTYNHSNLILSARNEFNASRERVSQAWSVFLPSIEATAYKNETESTVTASDDSVSENEFEPEGYSVTLSQPLFTGGSNSYSLAAAIYSRKAFNMSLNLTEENILIQAAITYMDLIKAQKTYELRMKSESVLQKQLDIVKTKLKVGNAVKTDLYNAEAAYEGAKANRINANGDLEASIEKYIQIIGKDPDFLEKPKMSYIDVPSTKEEYIDIVMENNHMIKMHNYNYKSQKAVKNANLGTFLPNVSLTASYSKGTNVLSTIKESEETVVGISARMPLFSGGRNIAKYKEQSALASSYENTYYDKKREVKGNAAKAWAGFNAAKVAKEAYENQVNATGNAFKASQVQYSAGMINIIDVLNNEEKYMKSSIDLLEAEKNEVVSYMQIMAYMGILLDNYKLIED